MGRECFYLHVMPSDGVILREYSHTHAAYLQVIACDRTALDCDWKQILQAAGTTITGYRSGIDDLAQGFTVCGCIDLSLIRGERGTYITLAGCYSCFEKSIETIDMILRTIDLPLRLSLSGKSTIPYDPVRFMQQIEECYRERLIAFRRDYPNVLIVPPHAFWSRAHEAKANITPEKLAIRRACLPWQRGFVGVMIDWGLLPLLLLLLKLSGAAAVTGKYAPVFRVLVACMLILPMSHSFSAYLRIGIHLIHDQLTHSFVTAKMQYLQSTLGEQITPYRIRGRVQWSDHRCQEILMAANSGRATYHSAYLHQMKVGEHYTVTYAKHSRILISVCAADGTEMLDFSH